MAEWNSTDDAAVRDGIAAGRTYEQIASELGRTPTAVQVRIFSLGLAQQQQQLPMDAAEVAPAKRRGRPPKAPAALNGHAVSVEAPKRRGRPPKAATNGHVAAPVAAVAAPAKRRGRPPKASNVAAPVAAVVAPAKRRGRPPSAPVAAASAAPAALVIAKKQAIATVAPAQAVAFSLALGSHRLSAEGAEVELISGGGLRLKFAGGSIELHDGASA